MEKERNLFNLNMEDYLRKINGEIVTAVPLHRLIYKTSCDIANAKTSSQLGISDGKQTFLDPEILKDFMEK